MGPALRTVARPGRRRAPRPRPRRERPASSRFIAQWSVGARGERPGPSVAAPPSPVMREARRDTNPAAVGGAPAAFRPDGW